MTAAREPYHLALSAFEMYEFHGTQSGTQIRPGQTFDLDYSLMRAFAGLNYVFPARKVTLSFKYFDEFSNQWTYQGYSLQISAGVGF